MSFFFSKISFRIYYIPLNYHVSSATRCCGSCLDFPCFFMTVTILRSTGQVFFIDCLYWDLSNGFLVIRLGLRGLGKKTTEIKCYFHHIISREHTVNMIITVDVDFDYLAEITCVRFLHCKVTPSLPYSFCALWKGSHCAQSALKPWEVMAHLFECRVSTLIYLEFFWPGGVSVLSHLFYTLGYNSVLLYFVTQIILALSIKKVIRSTTGQEWSINSVLFLVLSLVSPVVFRALCYLIYHYT